MLSAHTGAMLADPRCSLLVGEPGKGDPLAHPRMTLVCRAQRLERGSSEHARAERRYLNRNPKAKLYAGLGDFSIFRLEPERASLNGGFGKAYLLDRADLITTGPIVEELAASEQSALDHMNADHLDAIAVYARHFAKAAGDGWTHHRLRCRRHGSGVGRRCLPGLLPATIEGGTRPAACSGRHGQDRPGAGYAESAQLIVAESKSKS